MTYRARHARDCLRDDMLAKIRAPRMNLSADQNDERSSTTLIYGGFSQSRRGWQFDRRATATRATARKFSYERVGSSIVGGGETGAARRRGFVRPSNSQIEPVQINRENSPRFPTRAAETIYGLARRLKDTPRRFPITSSAPVCARGTRRASLTCRLF